MSKLEHKPNSAAEEREARMNNLAQRIANKEYCPKHPSMRFEYWGICNRVEYQVDTKFPIDAKDRTTGEQLYTKDGKKRKIWIPTEATRVHYMRYR